MKRIYLISFLLCAPVLQADSWLGGGGGIFIPLKYEGYSYDPGVGWKIGVQHNFTPQNTNYFGFFIAVSNYQNDINDFYFNSTTFRLKQNDIQLGAVYKVYQVEDHYLEINGGYLSRGIEGDLNQLNLSQTDSGFFVGVSDKFIINENFAVEGSLSWQFFETDTDWGALNVSGPKIELLVWLRVLSSK